MGSRRKLLLLLLVCCAFASFVSAQSISITFINEWGEQASKVLEQGKALIRVVDSGASPTGAREQVTVNLSSLIGNDLATTDLVETGAWTGVFEGEVNLTTDYYLDNYVDDGGNLLTRFYPPTDLDTVTATYGTASGSATASPSLTDLLDDSAWSQPDFAVGERVTVRVRDLRADLHSGPDTVVAQLLSSGGDAETLTLIETGSRTGVFEAALDLVAGAPVADDGQIQAAVGETITVTHPDGNGFSSSSDSATVSPATVRFINWRKAAPADPFVEGGEVAARVVDPAADTNPAAIEIVPVTFYRGSDREDVNLRETGLDTGVFEGRLPLRSNSYGWNNGFLEQNPLTDTIYSGRVGVAYGSLLSYADWTYSTIRLFDEAGEEASNVALGQTLRVRVKAAVNLYGSDADRVLIRVQDTLTGDEETLSLWETGGYTWLFEGDLRPEPGAAVPGDGRIQTQAGDTLLISHLDPYGAVHTSMSIPVRRSRIRYLDANGRPAPVLLENDKARVEVLDLLAGGQSPIAMISSFLGGDNEELSLSASGAPGVFQDTVPLTTDWVEDQDGDGALLTSWSAYPVNQLDTVTTTANDAFAKIRTAPAILEFRDVQGGSVDSAVAGARLYVRATAPRAGASPSAPEGMLVYINSLRGGDTKAFYLQETGADTKVFEGWVDTDDAYAPSALHVEPADTVQVRYDPPYGSDALRTVASLPIVPSRLLFVDGQDRVTSTFLYNEPIRLRVEEPAANISPNGAETVTVKVRAWRQSDDRLDVETVSLVETGADTGIFTGSLPGSAIPVSSYPSQENGVLQYPELTPPYNDTTTVVASRGNASQTATLKDSELWLTDLQGNDTTAFPIGSTMKVWLRRPRGNVTAGVDYESVEAWTRTDIVDLEPLTLMETGDSTGLFTGTLPIVASPKTSYNGTLGGSVGDPIEAHKISYSLLSFDMGVLVGASAPVAADDFVTTNEDVVATIEILLNDYSANGAPLTVSNITQGAFGSVAIDPSGSVTYTPNANFNGSDSFSYTVSDPSGLTDDADVWITVVPVNDEPVASDDSASTAPGTPVTINVLANDSDPDGDTLLVDWTWPASNGTVTINANGTVTYTPNPGFQGIDSFYYSIHDSPTGSSFLSDSALVTVTVQGNRAPDAVNDSATTNEDTAVTVAVGANDTDPDGDTLTITAVTQGTRGSVAVNNGSVIYTPAANANGSDAFTYTVSDGHGGTDTATVSITINPINDVPRANEDAVTTNEDTPVTFDPRLNDTDPDGDILTTTSVSLPSRGSAVINANGTVTYTPSANLNGTDLFVYGISDGNGGTWSALITVTITPVNDVPDARNDIAGTDEDAPITLSVRSNDVDIDGDTLTIQSITQPTNGTAVINSGATITYTPNPNFTGSDSLSYTISDGKGGSDTATVSISVYPVNDPPVAGNDSATVDEDGSIILSVRDNDSDPDGGTLTITAVTQGAHGTVTIVNSGTQVKYQPAASYFGPDTFTYTVKDPANTTAVGTVSMTVNGINDAPDAVNDSAATNEDTPATIPVRSNDTDADGDALTITAASQGTKGSVAINAGTTVTYTPNANASGSDTFTYTISDGNGATDTATVAVTITSVNDAPDAVNDSFTTNEDTPVTVAVRSNDTDVEGDTLTITAVTQGTKGSVAINAGAMVTYTPNANANGGDSFTYTISDGNGGTDTATVAVTINSVNDAPVAVGDAAATNENVPVAISVLANDSDIDGGALSVSAVTQGAKGSVTTNGTTVTYTPAANTNGADAFTYTVSDGQGATAIASVTVSVSPINDPPVAAPDGGATRENIPVIIPVLANDTDPEGNPLTVTAASTPPNGMTSRLADNTVLYQPHPNFTGSETFTYTVNDGQGGTSVGQVTVVVGEALERVAVLATNSVALRTGSDVLSGDVIVNQAGAGPFLNGAELSVGGTVTTPSSYDVEGDSLTVAAGAVVSSDVRYNNLTNSGTISGLQTSPLPLPVFSALPPFLTATPGTTNISVGTNGTRTLAAGSYQDLVVGRKGTVTFTGGTYHFRTITVDREAKLYFTAASVVRVQQKLSTKNLTTIGPAAGATIDASSILIYVAGINGTSGALTATPKTVEIGVDNVLKANVYAPNGTLWLQDRTQATGAFLGKDIDVGVDAQVNLDSAFAGGQ